MGGRGMIDLKQCKFGDRLRTKSGIMVLFICKSQPINVYPFELDYEPDDEFICISESDKWFVYMTYDISGCNHNAMRTKTFPENEIIGEWQEFNNTNEYIFGNKFKTNKGEMAVFIAKLSNSFTDNVLKYAFVMPYDNTFALLLLEENELHDKNNPDSIIGKWEDEK